MSDSKIFNGVTKLIQYYISFTLARSVIGRPCFPACLVLLRALIGSQWYFLSVGLAFVITLVLIFRNSIENRSKSQIAIYHFGFISQLNQRDRDVTFNMDWDCFITQFPQDKKSIPTKRAAQLYRVLVRMVAICLSKILLGG